MMQTSGSAALETVLTYHRAWTNGDLERALSLLADDIICRTPDGDLKGKDAYRDYLAAFIPNLTGLTDVANFADGEHVALFYYPHTAGTTTALAAEHFTVQDGTITELLLVFDRLSFVPPTER